MAETLQIRIHGDSSLPTLIYLPGLHGDWTLVSSFRATIAKRVRFVEFTYPRTLSWTLDDYAREILQALRENGIERGWLLGESFGSQVLWRMLAQTQGAHRAFMPDGVILAGGFPRHPVVPAVRFAQFIAETMPTWALRTFFAVYGRVARFRHRHAPETFSAIADFLPRRTKADMKAMAWRLGLIYKHNPTEIVRNTGCPVFCLTGLLDPIVPWFFVFRWMKRNCPTLQARKIIPAADHNVLGTAPGKSAAQILEWVEFSKSANFSSIE